MPFNGSGTFSIVNTFVPNTTILSAAVNQNFTDIATGLSDCLTRDGQAGMTAALGLISGSSAVPSLKFNSDAASGIYSPASGALGLVANALGIKINSQTYAAISATIQAGGSGYAIGDTLYVTGGTSSVVAVFTVSTVSSGVVTAVTMTVPGIYTAVPSNPVSQGSTSGAGTGCTLNITWNNLSTPVYNLGITDLANALLWTRLGASSFVSGLMGKANGLDFATGIGATNLVQVISGSFIIPPGGILSPLSSTTAPIPTSDQTAVTRVYWTPYAGGNNCPIYNGSAFINTTSAQIFADLTAGAQASGGIYDVYTFLVSGTPTLGFSPSWSAGTGGSVTAGSCARGTSTGGTALTWLSGVPTNAVSMTLNNGATTYTIAANQATYRGSIYINSTAGQYNCHLTYGQSRIWGLYNANAAVQRDIILLAGDSTTSWTYASSTIRPSNNASANNGTAFLGLAQSYTNVKFSQVMSNSGASVGAFTDPHPTLYIGVNSTTVGSGYQGQFANAGGAFQSGAIAEFSSVPFLGIATYTCLESSGGVTNTFGGTQPFMRMSIGWRG